MATEINGNSDYVNLFTTKAHVFQINPITNSTWLQKGDHAIPISFVTNINQSTNGDSLRKLELRIIGIDDNDNTVLNATILPKTVFTQKTPKFGQWFDHTKTLYGLGFNSPDDLTEFIEKFHHFQDEIFKALPTTTEQNSVDFINQKDWQIREQLKYENERLKQALEESSMNAVAWNNELSTLRTNNIKLTQALQESKSNVDDWYRELISLRDENKELMLKASSLKLATNNNDNCNTENGSDYQKDLQKYKNYVAEMTNKLRAKDDEIEELQRCMNELELKVAKQQSEEAFHDDNLTTSSECQVDKRELKVIDVKFVTRLNELANVQKEFAQLLERVVL